MTSNAQSNGSSNLEIAQSNQDLIMTKGKTKKRRWIIGGVVSALVVGLVVAAIVLLVTKDEAEQGPALSLEDLLEGKLSPDSFNATWASDNELLYKDADGHLILRSLSAETRQPEIIVKEEDMILGGINFEISADKKYLKVAHNVQKVYRYSFRAQYTIIELSSNKRIELHVENRTDLQLAVWGPVGNALAFVFDNNIYYKSTIDSEENVQITSDGNFVYNGIPDWVYEEEVFSTNKALWFSPDGNKLAYAKFNDTQVPLMVLPIYGEPGSLLFQYPRASVIRYPKAGTTNPVVSLHSVDLRNLADVRTLNPPDDLTQTSSLPILTTVAWATDDTIIAIWMNRIQNDAYIVSYLITQDSMEIIKYLRQDSGWLELFTPPIFSKDGSQMTLILSVDQGGTSGSYRHVVLLSKEADSQIEPLTNGTFVVTNILGWNHDQNKIFYTANSPEDSAVQHLYSVSVDTKQTECLSCGLKSKNAQTDCLYNVAEFSKDSSHYVLTCAGPDVPHTSLYSLEKKLLDWHENSELQQLVRSKRLPTLKRLSFEVEGGFKAQVSLKLPPNLDESTKYPMLVNVYAGPDSFQVVEKFNVDWGSYLAANKSIIYATIDGRSSGLKGDNMLFASYKKLGTVEIIDQINVTKQIQETLPYVDSSRTAVWGWSYGGYASGMILATDNAGTFKCGMSVAPVTDWALYDSIYTERFMGLPQDNAEGYSNANLLDKYAGLRDKQYFLIHGTYDDNVHYQQSMLWAKVLEQNDILFRQLSYPDEDHGLASVRPHLYHSLEDFLDECFIEEKSN